MRPTILVLLAGGLAVAATPRTERPAPETGADVIRAAHAQYEGKWFHTVTFVQRTTLADGHLETWYESLQLPGKLRIDVAPLPNTRTLLFRADSLYVYVQGALRPGRALPHPLLIALYDLHVDAPDVTVRRLSALGFDLGKSHRTTWGGDPVVVVGAAAGDTTSNQLWFDARRMIVVRVIGPGPQGAVIDTHVGGYAAVGPWWHEREVSTYRNGTLTTREEYFDVQVDVPLAAEVFEPLATYAKPAWIGDGAARW